MNGKTFVDTNILIYAHDASDTQKHERAMKLIEKLWEEERGVLSAQVLQEFAINLRKNLQVKLSSSEVKRRIEDYLTWEMVINPPRSIFRALEMEEKYQVSFSDALIVQAAERAGCEILYSEDLSHGQKYEGVLVLNPFKDGFDW